MVAGTTIHADGIVRRPVWRGVWGRRRMVALVVLACTAISAVGLALTAPRYTAQSVVAIERPLVRSADTNVDAEAAAAIPDLGAGMQIATSRRLARRVFDQLADSMKDEFHTGERSLAGLVLGLFDQMWQTAGDPFADDTIATQAGSVDQHGDRAFGLFLERLTPRRLGTAPVIAFEVQSENPPTAAEIANRLADQFVTERLERQLEAVRRESQWIHARLTELRRQLAKSKVALGDHRAKLGLRPDSDVESVGRTIAELEQDLANASNRRALLQRRLRRIEALDDSPAAAEEAAAPEVGLVKEVAGVEKQLRGRLKRLADLYGEQHPDVRRVRAMLDDIQKSIAAELATVTEGLRRQVATATQRETLFAEKLERLRQEHAQSIAARQGLVDLEQQVQIDVLVLDRFIARFGTSGGGSRVASAGSDARVVARAESPETASYPPSVEILALAFGGSLGLGLLIAVAAHFRESGFRFAGDLESATGITVAARVPAMDDAVKLHDFVVNQPKSAYAESLRHLYTAILLTDPVNPPKRILVTSARAKEGRTTLCVSLARILAATGRRVLLVDADMAGGDCHGFFDMSKSPGLVELVADEAPFEDAIRRDTVSGCYVVPAGRHGGGLDIAASDRLKEVLNSFAEVFDVVIVDSPPVLEASYASLLAGNSDGVVFVVRWLKTPREAALQGLRAIAQSGGRFLRLAMTMVDDKAQARFGDQSGAG
jgi:capsular exopolysaccharide synthesis family protein